MDLQSPLTELPTVISIDAASGSQPGTMSSSNYSKLAGIESGADVTDASNVANAVEAFATATTLDTNDDWIIVVDGVAKKVDASDVESYLNSNLNFNNYTHPNHTGQVTSVGDGTQSLNVTAITAQTATTTSASTDELLINDGGALRRIDLQDIKHIVTYCCY